MEMYHFVTEWFFQAPIKRVWEEITDIESWPTWWQDFKNATIRGSESTLELGSVADCVVRGALPYTLRFSVQVTGFQPPNLLEIKSSGDLVGGGKWVLQRQNGGTASTFYWDAGITIAILDLLGKLPFAKAMMEKNHNDMMANGYEVLKSSLEGQGG